MTLRTTKYRRILPILKTGGHQPFPWTDKRKSINLNAKTTVICEIIHTGNLYAILPNWAHGCSFKVEGEVGGPEEKRNIDFEMNRGINRSLASLKLPFKTGSGDRLWRPAQETGSGDGLGRPARETGSGDRIGRPAQETSSGDRLRRPAQETGSGERLRRPAQDNGRW